MPTLCTLLSASSSFLTEVLSIIFKHRSAGSSIPMPTSERHRAKVDATLVLILAFIILKRNGPDTRLIKEFIVYIVESRLLSAISFGLRN